MADDDMPGLRDVLAMDDGESPSTPADGVAAPEPTDGEAPDDSAADAETEDEELSPEERVAEAVRADAEAEGVELPDASSDDDDEAADATEPAEGADDEEDLAEVLEEGRRARAERLAAEANKPFQAIYAEAERDIVGTEQQRETAIAHAEAHYERELQRLLDQIDRDAEKSVDPDAYRSQHRAATVRTVRAQERAWIAGIRQQANERIQQVTQTTQARVTEVQREAAKPAWAAYLAEQRGLPRTPEVLEKILAVGDPDKMPAIADLLVDARNASASLKRKHTAEKKELLAASVRAQNVHPGATGRAKAAKRPALTGEIGELRAILSLP